MSLRKIALMPASNSSINARDDDRVPAPGHRSGEGSESVLPFLHDSLATRPGELSPSVPAIQPTRSVASRVRRTLARIRQLKGDEAGPR